MRNFVHTSHPSRVIFGTGTVGQVRDEVERLGCSRVLLLAGPAVAAAAARVRDVLGDLIVAEFDGAAMHTPVEVTERALDVLREHAADCLVAVGGGSTTGLAKALALRTDLPQVILPTTYSGSEVTPVLGETQGGRKITQSSPTILPETVVYDVEFTRDLPVGMSVTSGVNALAHAVEALYSPQANPVIDGMALDAVGRIARALPVLVAQPSDTGARADLLHAAWLAGTCLASVGMGLHHKLCHTLGGTFGLPHAETHTVILPHAMAYNAPAARDVMNRIADALGVADAPSGVFDLIASVGGPTSLGPLGMAQADLSEAARLAVATPYPNPRELTYQGIEGLLQDAWRGRRPASPAVQVPPALGATADLERLTEQVVASFADAPDPRVGQLLGDLVRHLHHFVTSNDVTESEWQHAVDFLTRTGQICTSTRQEFVLLSDTLGVSSIVDLLTNSRTPETTPSAVLGPFYTDGPPETPQGADISRGVAGTPLWADIRVTDTEGHPLPDAVVDVWQANKDGFYDVQLPEHEGPVLRGRLRTDDEGRLRFWTTLPAEYPIPDDGPVGQMLQAVNRHPYRAPHLHFMISAPGHRRLVTQLFVKGGPYLDSDTVFGVKEGLVIDFAPRTDPTPDGRAVDGEWRSLQFTFRIARIADAPAS
ncbi:MULTISPECIES: maleylacetate reductase and hydroxyquinol 1,2-dioxygenase domain-containing protein [unclassified Streptomyces]|uniref:maleylacetate reductase and hydroxyquinol 1,2-dioxygenase domain-containing protein n=1 Tax=unclassified Streptomyces TaxID=2593676 RepID=UPI0029A18E2C|nr:MULTISPECIES: maleylacetate reductase and hydroxyquinol 1,2-dioxygenase domain-containing protein [unclassified Streptomyces]MDX3768567.1 maleylacetate reductase and hydroxyquinol 1,2-dioxygenase domain-containing protein [Streptomyces sp. AK08-01B]MDX3817898.1 maleylacetate reductase and hydroxyquinol 1,2-dioxygenase domain-containing protein [Streptomyces sp. AK08-01A]